MQHCSLRLTIILRPASKNRHNMLIDTHCHIHDDEFELDAGEVLEVAQAEGVHKLICIGTDAAYSKSAIEFASGREGVFASVGLHPHDASLEETDMDKIVKMASSNEVVAIGECGLDYYYDNSPREQQKRVLKTHFELAQELNLPMSFHVRGSKDNPSDAFDDFWELYDQYVPRGVIHSFSASGDILDQILERGLFVGVNGIVTFMKEGPQLDAVRRIPLESMVLETDAPLLTPVPFRGTINEPKHIHVIVGFLSQLRGESAKQIAASTTKNAEKLFSI